MITPQVPAMHGFAPMGFAPTAPAASPETAGTPNIPDTPAEGSITDHYEATFPFAWLQGLRVLSAKNDVRYYLNGVAIQDGRLAATTGLYIGVMQHPSLAGLPEIIIPNETIDVFAKMVKAYKDPDVTLRWTANVHAARGELIVGDTRLPFVAIDGRYPPVSRVLMDDGIQQNGYCQFDWTYMVLFAKAAAKLTGEPSPFVTLLQDADNHRARVRIPHAPYFDGVIKARTS